MGFGLAAINTLLRLADTESAAKAANNGLPTIDPSAFAAAVVKNNAVKTMTAITGAVSMVDDLMAGADKMIESLMNTPREAVDGFSGAKKAMAEANSAEKIAELKQAKEYALASGNYVPLLAITQPETSLKSLPKAVVQPDMSVIPKPLLTFTVLDFPKIVEYPYQTQEPPSTKVTITGAPANTKGFVNGDYASFETDATGTATVWLTWSQPYDEISGDESFTFIIPGCLSIQKTARVRVVEPAPQPPVGG